MPRRLWFRFAVEALEEQLQFQLKAIVTILVVCAFLGLGYGLWRLPILQVSSRLTAIGATLAPKDRLDAENAARTTLAQIVGGVAVLIGAYLTFRNIRAVEKNLTISQEGQITERFTRAIEQLGNDKTEIALGGVYGLERTARDSERDHWPVIEVLLAYLHTNAPQDEAKEREQLGQQARVPLPPLIQAVITVLSRRQREFDPPREYLDLSNLYLGGARLENARLQDSNLSGTRLILSDLMWARFDNSDLSGVRFTGSDMSNATLRSVKAQGTHFNEALLNNADLRGAVLKYVDMTGTALVGTRLEGVDLSSVRGLSKFAVDAARTDVKTVLPDYLLNEESPASS